MCMCTSDSCGDFAFYMKNALLAIPVLSNEAIKSLNGLKGYDEDNVSQFLKELILMQILLNDSNCFLQKIFPINVDDQKSASLAQMDLVPRASCPTMKEVVKVLKACFSSNCELENTSNRVKYHVKSSVGSILKLTKHEMQTPRFDENQEQKQAEGLHSDDDDGIEYMVDCMDAKELVLWKTTICFWASILKAIIPEIHCELDLVNAETFV